MLESLGYTVYTGYAMEYPRNSKPEYFADHIGALTVELVLATAEISALIVHAPPSLQALKLLQDCEAFPRQLYEQDLGQVGEEQQRDVTKVESKEEEEEEEKSFEKPHYVNYMVKAEQVSLTFSNESISQQHLLAAAKIVRSRFPGE
jgi:hypothetical protein